MPSDSPACCPKYINPRSPMTVIPNCLCLLRSIYERLATLAQWKIILAMIISANPILQQSSTVTSILLLSRMLPMSLLNFIELTLRNNILFLTCILRSSPLWCHFAVNFSLPFKSRLGSFLRFYF